MSQINKNFDQIINEEINKPITSRQKRKNNYFYSDKTKFSLYNNPLNIKTELNPYETKINLTKNENSSNIIELTSNYNAQIQDVFQKYIEYYHNSIPTALEEKIFLLIDEAHYDKNWARFAKTLYDKSSNIFMLFTGSSALELESNTDAVRRMKIERIYPMNFR